MESIRHIPSNHFDDFFKDNYPNEGYTAIRTSKEGILPGYGMVDFIKTEIFKNGILVDTQRETVD